MRKLWDLRLTLDELQDRAQYDLNLRDVAHDLSAQLDQLREALRRDWAARVLDAWLENETSESFNRAWSCDATGAVTICESEPMTAEQLARCGQPAGTVDSHQDFRGESVPASRMGAADAAWRALPESVRAEIGPKP